MCRLSSFWVCLVAVISPLIVATPCAAQTDDSLLNSIFQDHLVLQRNEPFQVWGTAAPGDTVTVLMDGHSVKAVADSNKSWSAQLPAMAAGGPHQLIARSSTGRIQTVKDVLIGDVYLCSGQSNMELPVDRTLNAPSEIDNASNERIRMMEVDRASSPAPKEMLPSPVEWEPASPETVSSWSAACYYFARDLQQSVDVPLGLIESSWGGTSITAWMSNDALGSIEGYEESLELLERYARNRRGAQRSFGKRWETWWREASGDTAESAPWQPQLGEQWPEAPAELGNWKEWGDSSLTEFNGMLWYRATVELTAEQASHDAVLSLGSIDEVDQTWMNGDVVGNTFGWGTPRTYSIPSDQLQEGENVVVVNVLNTWGQGGLLSPPPSRSLLTGTGERLALEAWQYKKAPPDMGFPPRAPWESTAGLSTLHNAMLAPLHNYGLKGILWYQGESDTDKGRGYLDHLQALKKQWRSQFGDDLPVLVVQLANYGPRSATPEVSAWAEVREAQRRATQNDPRTGLAVTIDVGSPYDIHPANKQEVGRRLARAGRHIIYGEDVSPSGPLPQQATQQEDTITVSFTDVEGSLVAHSHSRPIGFELCGSERGSCQYVDAQIDGTNVRLDARGVEDPTRVRYCWADSPTCTLYDEAELPAGPFELEVSASN